MRCYIPRKLAEQSSLITLITSFIVSQLKLVKKFGNLIILLYIKLFTVQGNTLTHSLCITLHTLQGKQEMLEPVRYLNEMGYVLYGSSGTADFYIEHGIAVRLRQEITVQVAQACCA